MDAWLARLSAICFPPDPRWLNDMHPSKRGPAAGLLFVLLCDLTTIL